MKPKLITNQTQNLKKLFSNKSLARVGFRYLNPTYISFDLELIRAVLVIIQDKDTVTV